MKKYWQQSSLITKIQVFAIVLIVGNSISDKLTIWRLRRNLKAEMKQQIKRDRDSLQSELNNIKKIVQNSINTTDSVQNKAQEIDKKIKKDEKIINNSTVTDDDIRKHISKHKKR